MGEMSFRIKKRYAHPILSEAALDEPGPEDGRNVISYQEALRASDTV